MANAGNGTFDATDEYVETSNDSSLDIDNSHQEYPVREATTNLFATGPIKQATTFTDRDIVLISKDLEQISEEIDRDVLRLQELRRQFLDSDFLELTAQHLNDPSPEFILFFNELCVAGENVREKIDLLSSKDYLNEIKTKEVPGVLSGLFVDFKMYTDDLREEYETSRDAFQTQLREAANQISPEFLAYLEGLEPTQDMPDISETKKLVDGVSTYLENSGGKLFPKVKTSDQPARFTDTRYESGLIDVCTKTSPLEKIGSWFSKRSGRVRAAVVGGAAVALMVLGFGGVKACSSQEQSLVGADEHIASLEEGVKQARISSPSTTVSTTIPITTTTIAATTAIAPVVTNFAPNNTDVNAPPANIPVGSVNSVGVESVPQTPAKEIGAISFTG